MPTRLIIQPRRMTSRCGKGTSLGPSCAHRRTGTGSETSLSSEHPTAHRHLQSRYLACSRRAGGPSRLQSDHGCTATPRRPGCLLRCGALSRASVPSESSMVSRGSTFRYPLSRRTAPSRRPTRCNVTSAHLDPTTGLRGSTGKLRQQLRVPRG